MSETPFDPYRVLGLRRDAPAEAAEYQYRQALKGLPDEDETPDQRARRADLERAVGLLGNEAMRALTQLVVDPARGRELGAPAPAPREDDQPQDPISLEAGRAPWALARAARAAMPGSQWEDEPSVDEWFQAMILGGWRGGAVHRVLLRRSPQVSADEVDGAADFAASLAAAVMENAEPGDDPEVHVYLLEGPSVLDPFAVLERAAAVNQAEPAPGWPRVVLAYAGRDGVVKAPGLAGDPTSITRLSVAALRRDLDPRAAPAEDEATEDEAPLAPDGPRRVLLVGADEALGEFFAEPFQAAGLELGLCPDLAELPAKLAARPVAGLLVEESLANPEGAEKERLAAALKAEEVPPRVVLLGLRADQRQGDLRALMPVVDLAAAAFDPGPALAAAGLAVRLHGQALADALARSPGEEDPLEDLHILMIDDEPAAFQLVDDMLEVQRRLDGWTIEHSQDFASFRDALERRPYDLLLIDVVMPGLDGGKLVRYVERHPDLLRKPPMLLLSSLPQDELDQLAGALGVAGTVRKGSPPEHLGREIEQAVRRTRRRRMGVEA